MVIGSFIMTTYLFMHHVSCSFLVKHQITQVNQSPYSPDLAPCNFWPFPKLKSPLKGKRFQTTDEIQENTMGQAADGSWENCVRSQRCLLWRGLRHHCRMFLETCIFFNKCLYFHIMWLDTFWTDLIYHVKHLGSKKFPLQTDHIPYFAMYNVHFLLKFLRVT